ncbi:4-phosphopantetheinyl transferase family protein [Micrococcus luteus]|uniref:4'-phosphopantetheinyl transferase family protein n=1 Tax=Micrococcus luteus TaxID=1270 RepID=UPI0019106FB3|nr:4'-phosphopantetheinyl transferase superfamily protein [Micrococcus luteus]QQE48552.1 4-phosphopantetheinyl transferase family protein [Micrococcus luteus]
MSAATGPWGLTSAVPASAGAADAVSALLGQVRTALTAAWGVPVGPLGLRHACAGCGSAAHGVPALTGLPPDRVALVSFTRVRMPGAEGRARIGAWWAPARPADGLGLGVDVERADAAAFEDEDGLGGVGFSTAERARVRELPTPERPAARARLWTRKEALVKAAGTGFTGDPAAVDALTVPADVVLVDLTDRLPGGLVGALARRGR